MRSITRTSTLITALFLLSAAGCTITGKGFGSRNNQNNNKFDIKVTTSGNPVAGSGTLKTETRTIGTYQKIEASGIVEVIVSKDAREITVTADDNLLPLIQTNVSGDTLKITTPEPIRSDTGVKITVPLSETKEIHLSGASKGTLTDFDNESLTVELSGATTLTADGTTPELTLAVSGASSFLGENLKAEKVQAELSGSSRARVDSKTSLNGELSGASTLRYKGTPTELIIDTSGASKVEQL